ncbi:TetR/AcrR family transcriptional regulator [Leucobacter allii]|uniref:TetR/AcrR family transcriptional regulator n=1 Tax=Leucobacter allii TaxID=2932247 RepID=A0ABY4FJ91_9MICO|nr:TetR family transcriptional regulator [Leucobacter allii]UOQ56753.1 TetR/AcrR family transcriptional regulator [Leucobacter allii]UOR01186.1 TetR/AcrR family transcriptional regulator [Leucobacter allii]
MSGSGRSQRGRLDRRVIVDALLELARTDPRSRITFKRLGEALGVDATAMYRHFRNKDDLTRAALDVLAGAAARDAAAAPGGWRDRLEAYLLRVAELSLEHPSIGAEGAVIDPVGPGDVAADEFILTELSAGGLAGDALIRAYAAISGFALAQSAALAQEVMARADAARDGSIPWISTFGAVDLSPFPLVSAHRDRLLAISGIEVYRAGAEAILDSIERAAAAEASRV